MITQLSNSAGWPTRVAGSRDRPAVVFLHGFMGSRDDWNFLLPEFAENFYCVFPDLPGHGQNQGSLPAEPLTFSWLADGLLNLLDQLHLPAVHLVGYSMGGRLAVYFSRDYSKRVRSLVLESASPGLTNSATREARRREDALRAASLKDVGLAQFLDEWYRLPLFASLQDRPELLARLKIRRQDNDPLELARVIAELSPGQQPDLWGDLPGISMPVLLLAGDRDEKYSLMVKHMAVQLPRARVILAPGAGHNLHLEAPDWYIRQLRDFLV